MAGNLVEGQIRLDRETEAINNSDKGVLDSLAPDEGVGLKHNMDGQIEAG